MRLSILRRWAALWTCALVLGSAGLAYAIGWTSYSYIWPRPAALALGSSESAGTVNATLTGYVIAGGMPWGVTVSSVLPNSCATSAPQALPIRSGSVRLRDLDRHDPAPSIFHPYSGTIASLFGLAQTWQSVYDAYDAGHTGVDVLAAAYDNNGIDRDNSQIPKANKTFPETAEFDHTIAGENRSNPAYFAGVVSPTVNMHVNVYTSDIGGTGRTIVPAYVSAIGMLPTPVLATCNGKVYTFWKTNQFMIESVGRLFGPGDQGAAVVSTYGYFIGNLSWQRTTNHAEAGGDVEADLKRVLRYDSWWTAQSVELDAWLSPVEFSTAAPGTEVCADAYVFNKSYTTAALNVLAKNTTILPANQPRFTYYNPNGTPNNPYTIAARTTQKYRLCYLSTVAQGPYNFVPIFYGDNAAAPLMKTALNTWGIVWSSLSLPSFQETASTPSGDTVVHVGIGTASTLYTVTLKNTTAAASYVTYQITGDLGLGKGELSLQYPGLNYSACEVVSGVCRTTLATQWLGTIGPFETKKFNVYVKASAGTPKVPYDPAYNILFFKVYSGHTTAGSSTIANLGLSVTTQ